MQLRTCAGDTQFCINVTDGASYTTACVNIRISPPNMPVATDDAYSCQPYTTCALDVADGVLKNDTTPNAGPITVTSYTQPAAGKGTVTVNPDGSLEWKPPYRWVLAQRGKLGKHSAWC